MVEKPETIVRLCLDKQLSAHQLRLLTRGSTLSERLVQAQLIADQDQRADRGRAKIIQHLADELIQLEGQTAFDERQRERRKQLRAIEDGLLRRGLFTATRPA